VASISDSQFLNIVDLDQQRGEGATVQMPPARVQGTGPVAVILWDEVSKGRTQNGGANIGVGIQNSNVKN
jgi:hypothetical protein